MRPLPLYPLISVSYGQILDSKDPLDAPNFDPVAYINDQVAFPRFCHPVVPR